MGSAEATTHAGQALKSWFRLAGLSRRLQQEEKSDTKLNSALKCAIELNFYIFNFCDNFLALYSI